jgi:YfiR/HmsC-like
VALLNAIAKAGSVLIVIIGAPVSAQAQAVDEYQVKAAYMYNFAKFVDWPAGTLDGPAQPIAFCVLGQTPLGQPLHDTLSGKAVDQRPLVFRQLSDSKQAGMCQVLFIGSLDKKLVRQTLDEIKSLPVLTVGEAENFTNDGGIVRFVLDAGRVRLEFNLDAADGAKLRISSKLLGLASVVKRAGK